MNERVSHHRVVSGLPRDAYTPASRSHQSVQTLRCVSDSDEQRVTQSLQTRARSNGYSCMVSAEGNRLMNERVPHHRVVSDVLRDAQTPAPWSHTSVQTLGCVLRSDE